MNNATLSSDNVIAPTDKWCLVMKATLPVWSRRLQADGISISRQVVESQSLISASSHLSLTCCLSPHDQMAIYFSHSALGYSITYTLAPIFRSLKFTKVSDHFQQPRRFPQPRWTPIRLFIACSHTTATGTDRVVPIPCPHLPWYV